MKLTFLKGFLSGIIACVILISGSLAYANGGQLIEVLTREVNYILNGQDIELTEGESFIYEGRTYVPLRFIIEALGQKVDWNEETQTVYIDDKEEDFTTWTTLNEKVIEDIISKIKDLESYSMEMKVIHNMEFDDFLTMTISAANFANVIRNPGLVSSGILEFEWFDIMGEFPYYYMNERLFLKSTSWQEEHEQTWLSYPKEFYDFYLLMNKINNQKDQPKILVKNDSEIKLKIEGSGEDRLPWLHIFYPDPYLNRTVQLFRMEIVFDKDSYMPKTLSANMNFIDEDEYDSDSDTSNLEVEIVYSNYNQHTEFPVPTGLDMGVLEKDEIEAN